ncbi:MAG TPA: peptidoglycan DD-metalloendopeptidase family protein [Gemmatimonadales bacterium]|nr:peptidoglycan DD-metalloendopeptidase family protein [Gemmatimonadales bacterium]
MNAFRAPRSASLALLTLVNAPHLASTQQLPPLPEPVPVLALAQAPDRSVWAGTYGAGIYVLRAGATTWEHIAHSTDTAAHSISWDFVHAFGFAPQGEVWYGTVGNGWGVSLDGGKTWTNWELKQLGPEWQYVAPNGIVTRGDTVYVATADGIKLSFDRGATWAEITDSAGATTAQHVWGRIANQYVLAIAAGGDGSLWIAHLRGLARSRDGGRTWTEYPTSDRGRALMVQKDGSVWVGTEAGLYRFDPVRRARLARVSLPAVQSLAAAPSGDVHALTLDGVYAATGKRLGCDAAPLVTCRPDHGALPDTAVLALRHTWFARPIALTDQPYIDQTYRFGSTMGGNFQQHQGVEFNNPNGTPVHAIGAGVVVFAGPAEQGSNTVAIRHDRTLKASDGARFLFSVYYHNSALLVTVGQRVNEGDVIARVGNTGRATNDHLHLEVHASPYDSVSLIVDPNERYPRYTTNPELWIAPLAGTGVVAGQVWDADGRPVQQARVYGLGKAEPQETPYAYAETYGEHNHSDPAYQEHFAVSDVPPGDYTLTVTVNDRQLTRRVRVKAGAVTWVEFRPDAH